MIEKIEDMWHYKRICKNCGKEWDGLHCPHDGYQNACPHCGYIPQIENGECNCEFNC